MRVRNSKWARRAGLAVATAFGALAIFAGVAGPATHHATSTSNADAQWFHVTPNDAQWF
jgi:hypothetical protein